SDLAALPRLLDELFGQFGRRLDLIAVIVGPGSFTGLRASIALAHGVALAAGVPVVGVTVGAALRSEPAELPFWAAIDSKRGRVFLEREGRIESVALDALPLPSGPIVLGGDAALPVGEALAARGAEVRLVQNGRLEAVAIAKAALAGRTVAAQPIYVDPPAAQPGPAGRPAPE
ncbi:MAG: tRNA (adenosine(37)-N6)-threonylcarbamoyltransferase complex dimerization subunit type 1 TsaB, partial [Pseudomonadota bacterium]|nr:tRNA (adenosine(37)-N6)-threonylcarbamoyltransferase complex dimerization subunit type 1 TsaB [Pseudomonadota bacterium]